VRNSCLASLISTQVAKLYFFKFKGKLLSDAPLLVVLSPKKLMTVASTQILNLRTSEIFQVNEKSSDEILNTGIICNWIISFIFSFWFKFGLKNDFSL
jgi:hypothetical protein